MDKWEIDAGELVYILFELNLPAWTVQYGKWLDPHPGPQSWMGVPGGRMTRSDWDMVTCYPIEDQKRIVSDMVKFDPDDIKAFEEKYQKLLSTQENTSPSQPTESSHSQQNKSNKANETIKKELPDPIFYTKLNWWIRVDETLMISTYTDEKRDGECEFPLINGKTTKQMCLLMILIEKRTLTVWDFMKECYSEEINRVKDNLQKDIKDKPKGLLNKVKSLVSDVRKKLRENGINPEIISPLGPDVIQKSLINLRVMSVNNINEKPIESVPGSRSDQALGLDMDGLTYGISTNNIGSNGKKKTT